MAFDVPPAGHRKPLPTPPPWKHYKAEFRSGIERTEIDTSELSAISIKLGNGSRIEIELFDRNRDGTLCIRTPDGSLVIRSHSSNVISVDSEQP